MTIQRFRKKPVEVEAVQWTGNNAAELHEFTGRRFMPVPVDERADMVDPAFNAEVFDVLHGTWVGVKTSQWIIRGVKGEFYPIDEQVLADTYEPVEVPSDAH